MKVYFTVDKKKDKECCSVFLVSSRNIHSLVEFPTKNATGIRITTSRNTKTRVNKIVNQGVSTLDQLNAEGISFVTEFLDVAFLKMIESKGCKDSLEIYEKISEELGIINYSEPTVLKKFVTVKCMWVPWNTKEGQVQEGVDYYVKVLEKDRDGNYLGVTIEDSFGCDFSVSAREDNAKFLVQWHEEQVSIFKQFSFPYNYKMLKV